MVGRISGIGLMLAALAGPVVAGDRAPGDPGVAAVAGAWTGAVSEIGMPRYRLRLSIAPDGSGRAVYPDFPCSARLSPVPGDGLVFGETVVEGRHVCADGTVEIAPAPGGLRWLWRDATGAIRATALLAPAG